MNKKICGHFLLLSLVITMAIVFFNIEPVAADDSLKAKSYTYVLKTGKMMDNSTNKETYNGVAYLYPGDTLSCEGYTNVDDTTYKHNNGYCWGDCEYYGVQRTITTVYSGFYFQQAGSVAVSEGSNIAQETINPQFVVDGEVTTKSYVVNQKVTPKSGYVLKVWSAGGYNTRDSSGLQCEFGKALDEYNVWTGNKMYVQTFTLNTISGLPASISKSIDAAPFTISGTIASGDEGSLMFSSSDTSVISVRKVDRLTAEITVNGNGTANIEVTTADPEGYMGYKVYIPVTISSSHTHTLTTKTTPATLTANGKVETKCSDCGEVTKSTVIYAAKTIQLSATKYTYDGKVKKPSVVIKDSKGKTISSSNYTVSYASGRKNVGTYDVKIKFSGKSYKGEKKLSFVINPPKTTLNSVKAGKKSFTATWSKKTTEVTGYEIQYSTSSTFKSGNKSVKVSSAKTTSKTIKNLTAKKKYYVRIRTYKTVGKTNYYSDWSANKPVTTKK